MKNTEREREGERERQTDYIYVSTDRVKEIEKENTG